jgi:hypothetical protein
MSLIACPECKKVECDCGYFEPCPGCERPIDPTIFVCPYCQCNVLSPPPKAKKPTKPTKSESSKVARPKSVPVVKSVPVAESEPEEIKPPPRKPSRQAVPSKTLPPGYDEDDRRYTVSKQQMGIKNAYTHVTDFEFDSLADAKKMADKTASDDRPSIVHDRMSSEIVYRTHPLIPQEPTAKKRR